LIVWLVPEPGFPKAAVAIAVRGGLASDPSDRPGISELLAKTVAVLAKYGREYFVELRKRRQDPL
jgi:hypothetical protein